MNTEDHLAARFDSAVDSAVRVHLNIQKWTSETAKDIASTIAADYPVVDRRSVEDNAIEAIATILDECREGVVGGAIRARNTKTGAPIAIRFASEADMLASLEATDGLGQLIVRGISQAFKRKAMEFDFEHQAKLKNKTERTHARLFGTKAARDAEISRTRG